MVCVLRLPGPARAPVQDAGQGQAHLRLGVWSAALAAAESLVSGHSAPLSGLGSSVASGRRLHGPRSRRLSGRASHRGRDLVRGRGLLWVHLRAEGVGPQPERVWRVAERLWPESGSLPWALLVWSVCPADGRDFGRPLIARQDQVRTGQEPWDLVTVRGPRGACFMRWSFQHCDEHLQTPSQKSGDPAHAPHDRPAPGHFLTLEYFLCVYFKTQLKTFSTLKPFLILAVVRIIWLQCLHSHGTVFFFFFTST